MSKWIDINDKIPEPKQPIRARFFYQGQIEEINGARSDTEEKVVLFDFYSGTGAGTIVEWKPRELPNKADAHPWTGIENRGL